MPPGLRRHAHKGGSMEVQLDLFGEDYEAWPVLWFEIEFADERTRLARYQRSLFLATLADGRTFMLPAEMGLLLEEARSTFVHGEFTATLLLVLSFIEHWLSRRMVQRQQSKTAARGRISEVLKHLRKTGELPLFLIECIDKLREVRNPITHSMPGDEYRIDLISMRSGMSDRRFLEREARRALGLLYAVADYMPDPWPVHDRLGKETRKAWLDDPNWQVPGDLPPTHHGMYSPRMWRS
jgi:hypothetical protein